MREGKRRGKGKERKCIFLCFVFRFPLLKREEVEEGYQLGSPVTSFQSLTKLNPFPSTESCSSWSGHNSEE